MTNNTPYNYLGNAITGALDWNSTMIEVTYRIAINLEKMQEADLGGRAICKYINETIIATLRYKANLATWDLGLLNKLQTRLDRAVRESMGIRNFAKGLLWSNIDNYGLGLRPIRWHIYKEKIKHLYLLLNEKDQTNKILWQLSNDTLIKRNIKKVDFNKSRFLNWGTTTIPNKKGTKNLIKLIPQKGKTIRQGISKGYLWGLKKIFQELELSTFFNEKDSKWNLAYVNRNQETLIEEDVDTIFKEILLDKIELEMEDKVNPRMRKLVFIDHKCSNAIRKLESISDFENNWLIKARSNILSTGNIHKWSNKLVFCPKCRRRNPTLLHAMVFCRGVVKAYSKRHNNVLSILAKEAGKSKHWDKIHEDQFVDGINLLTKDECRQAKRPDLILINSINRHITIIEVAVVWENNIAKTRRKKIKKYKWLINRLKNKGWKKVIFIPAIFGCLAGISTFLKKDLQKSRFILSNMNKTIKDIQILIIRDGRWIYGLTEHYRNNQ